MVDRKLLVPEGTDIAKMVIAPAVGIGDLIYLSGSAGDDSAKSALAGDDIELQARQAMVNLGRVLEGAGSSWEKVVKVKR
jgi:2-iminobutanoate/2-iminopropanoate deaminase